MNIKILLLGAMTFFLLQRCTTDDDGQPGLQPGPSNDRIITPDELSTALNAFQWKLFQQTVADENKAENLIISPLSIASALYLALEGANTETRAEMAQSLGFDFSGSITLASAYEALSTQLEGVTEGLQLSQSNAVFWDEGRITPHDQFISVAQDHFDADRIALDLQAASAVDAINNWVKQETGDRIDKILESIAPEEVMFLINALFFTGDWLDPFVEDLTREADFVASDGSSISTPFMFHDTYEMFSYRDGELEAVELPFADTNYSLTVLASTAGIAVDPFVASLTADRLATLWQEDLQSGRIMLNLPKFEISFRILLNDVLKGMGMQRAFDPNGADFSRLGQAPEGNLFISKVNHKSYLKIDEKGAEGAAVTSVGVGVTSLPPVFDFNRPFVFVLRDRQRDTIIFVGKLEDPSASI